MEAGSCLYSRRNCSTSFCVETWLLRDNSTIKHFKMPLKYVRLHKDSFFSEVLVLFPSFIHSVTFLFLPPPFFFFPVISLYFSITKIITSSPLRKSSDFSLYEGSSRQLCHQVRWKLCVSNRLVEKAPGARRR